MVEEGPLILLAIAKCSALASIGSTRRRGRLVTVGPSPIPNQDPNPPQRCASEKIRT
jgi:hypothetical protein